MKNDNLTTDKVVLRNVYNKTGIKIYCNPARNPKTNR